MDSQSAEIINITGKSTCLLCTIDTIADRISSVGSDLRSLDLRSRFKITLVIFGL